MKILLTASARSGSTALASAIGKILKYPVRFEPYDKWVETKQPVSLKADKLIEKNIVDQIPKEKFSEYSKRFDKLIFLTRENLLEAYESFYYKVYHQPGNWHSYYTVKEGDIRMDQEIYDRLEENHKLVKSLAYMNNISYISYEDIYSSNYDTYLNAFSKLQLDLDPMELKTYLDPKHRYRKFKKTVI